MKKLLQLNARNLERLNLTVLEIGFLDKRKLSDGEDRLLSKAHLDLQLGTRVPII
jgi:hypothetical protein